VNTDQARGHTILDLAMVVAENARLLVLLPLVAGTLALGIAFIVSPTYTATTRILPPTQQQSASALLASQLGPIAGLLGGAGAIKNPADQYVGLLKSRSVYDAIIARFDLKERYNTRFIEQTHKELESRIRVLAGVKDGIISIEVEDQDPRRAADMANAFVEELRNLLKSLALTEAAQRRLFFEGQLNQAKENLTKAEIALRGSGVSEATLKTVPQAALDGLARLKAQITAQEIKLASMRTFMTNENPEFRLALQELAALRAELAKQEQTSNSSPAANGVDYVGKYREFKYQETLFELMAKQYEVARLDEARDGSVIQVVDAAQPPQQRTRPKRALTAFITTLATFLVLASFIFVREALRSARQNAEFASKIGRLHALLLLAVKRKPRTS
jgi:tyrosine-protein kinase Etk/Wzc